MFNDRYINSETLDTLDYVSEFSEQREKYFLKPLSSENFNMLKKKLPFTTFSKGVLNDVNPLLPKDIFGEDKEVAFIKLENQKFSQVGLVMFGKFHNNDDYQSDMPDSLNVFLAKKNKDGKIVLWKNLKTTPGFETVYKYGNSFYTQKQMIVSGANDDHRGSTAIETSSYEIIQHVRNFFSKAEKVHGQERKIINGIINDDYSVMDYNPLYKKIDTWSVKMNELASGKLENVMYTSSQIHDADFLKTKTSPGEQYLMSKKLDNEIFDIMASGFKRNSNKNRVGFFKFFNKEKKDMYSSVEDGKPLNEFHFMKQKIIEFNTAEFRNNLNTFFGFKQIFSDEVQENEYIEKLRNSKEIRGRQINNLLGKNNNDYLYKRKLFKEKLYEIIEREDVIKRKKYKNENYKSNFDTFVFNKSEIKKIIDNLENNYKDIEKQLIKEMSERIESKFDAAFDKRYYSYLKDVKKEDREKMFGLIEKDITREFYDKFNEKLDLYDIMMRNRKKETVSEIELVAERVNFEYDKNGNIVDVKPFKKETFDSITDLSKDVDLKWGYYKARNQVGYKFFDKLPLHKRLEMARKYKDKNKSYQELYKKMSEKTLLGKYDSYENFNKSRIGNIQYNLLDDSVVARTNDKVIAKMDIYNNLGIKGSMKYGDKMFRLNINLGFDDGFNKNDYIKEMSSQRQASFKSLDLEVQKFIEEQAKTGRKVYKLKKIISKAQSYTKDQKEYEKLNKMISFLQGQKDRDKSSHSAIWGLQNGQLVYLKDLKMDNKKIDEDIVQLKRYNDVYDEIINYMKSNYNNKVGYALYDVYRMKWGPEKEDMSSLSELQYEIIRRYGNKIDNTTFMAILNNDQLINTMGASKQQSLIQGNTYLGHLGFAQPGLAWNKITQRTFQAQDILGEQYINIDGKRKTVSEINADIIKRLGFSGVGKIYGQYVTDNLYKSAVNKINKQSGLNNSYYMRGETYKTFAIGDVNSYVKDSGINNFNLSFQEGMTAAESMILTTNSIRNKQFNLNIEEIDYELLGFDSKKQLHEKLLSDGGLDEVLKKVINENLYGTIDGRKKYEETLTILSNPDILKLLDDGSYSGMKSYYNKMASVIGVDKKVFSDKDTEINRMKITKEIYKNLATLREKTGAIALPNTQQGKNTITTDIVKSHNELKPELGFSISDYKYNVQTGNIELMLENIGINSQGSKGQTTGAKYTISENYDFLKIFDKNHSKYIDAVFNNKAEKRTQTGMIIHSALQTVFTNVYEASQLEGIKTLKENMRELLDDMNVNIIIDEKNNTYRIDERYLTVNPETNKIMTVEEFQKYMQEPTENLSKLFNDRGRTILDNLIKKYSSQYTDDEGNLIKQSSHVGILNAMTKAYDKTSKDLGKNLEEFMIKDVSIEGYANGTSNNFGTGNFWLLKLSSERVNSTSSKKKESGLKISREMSQRQIAAGYREMVDFTDKRNKKRLSNFLGDVFNNMSNAELLNEVYKHKQDFDISQLNLSISETLRNGILFNLDSLQADDYLFDDRDVYLTHSKFKENSLLGNLIRDKGLGEVVDGKLTEDINIVVNDKDINNFTKDIKKSIKNVKSYYENLSKTDDKAKNTVMFFDKIENLNFSNDNKFKFALDININKLLKNENLKNNIPGQDIYRTAEFLGLIRNNLDNKYSLEQLQTIMKTGNIVTTINLNYDVDEATDQIVSSNSFSKLRNIARKNFELNHMNKAQTNFIEKIDSKDKSLVDDIYSGMKDYYSGKTKLSDYSIYQDLFSELNFENKYLKELQDKTKEVNSKEYMLKVNIESANKFFRDNYSKLDLTREQAENKLKETQDDMIKLSDSIDNQKRKILDEISDKDIENKIKSKLEKTIFGNERLNYKKKISSFYNDKIKEYFDSSFELLNEYISVPADSEGLFKKKGSITDKQKFKVESSYVANPLEGSNLLNKFEDLLFKIDKKHSLKNNIVEFQEFLGSDIVNENLFKDENGINWLDKLDETGPSGYKEGLKKAREIFNKNISEISEITISNKQYANVFRDKDFKWEDIYDSKGFEKRGFVREMAFLSRHPQQTINHMGAIMNITVDTNSRISNRFAKATLTYLPKEKNNAGIITLGKKTMLYRRGDHDGDKIQLALLDFIDDHSISIKTKSKMYLDFQLKNNSLGKWNESKGAYDEFTGNVLIDGKLTKLSEDRNIALSQIMESLGMNEEQLNMRTKNFNIYSHAVFERARKELNKHYNSIYEMMSDLRSSSKTGDLLSKEDVNLVRDVVDKATKGVHSNIAKNRIRGTYNVLRKVENGVLDLSSYVNDMDLIGQTAIYLLNRNKKQGIKLDSDSLYKKTLKELDKFISRGDFDEFYKESSSKAVFDELTGIRNTGLTHSYATNLMMASVELGKINPTDVMSKIGEYTNNKLDINDLSEMKRKQEYYSLNMDLFVDNMIESAISAKHGLTLGGLEGSKIFINELLDMKADNINNKVIQMYDDAFINNNQQKVVNLLENVAFYKTEFDKRNKVLEDITNEVIEKGLDEKIFMKQFDLGIDEFQLSFKNTISENDMKKYLAFGFRYKQEVRDIELSMFKHALDKKYVNPDEYKIFQGLNLFGELLIQNDPGLEYDTDTVNELLNKFSNKEITYEELIKNSDIKNLKYQVETSLGSAASISNVGKLRHYLSAFVESSNKEKLWNDFEKDITEAMKYNAYNFSLIKKHNISDIFKKDFSVNRNYTDKIKLDDNIQKLLFDYSDKYLKSSQLFYNEVIKKGSDPMSAYLTALNKNYTLFNQSGKEGNVSLEMLKEFNDNGLGSLNESVLSKSIQNIDTKRKNYLDELINKYSEYDSDFNTFSTDELTKKLLTNPEDKDLQNNVIKQLNDVINDTLFFKNKDKIPYLKLGDESKMVKLRFSKELNDQEKKLKEWGKLYQIYPQSTQTSNPLDYLITLLKNDNRQFIISDLSLFNKKTKDNKIEFDTKRFNKVIKLAQEYDNLFFSENISKRIFLSKNMYDDLLKPEERRMIANSLLNAKKYLAEDFTRENVLKRMELKFDSELATSTAVGRFIHDNPELNKNNFSKKMKTNLKKIIEDFSSVDGSISNDFINPNYIKMAKTYVDAGREYISVGKLDDDIKRFKRSHRSIERIISQQRKWFEENEIDTNLFSKMVASEWINQDKKNLENIKKIIMNVAQAMKGSDVSDMNLKFNPKLDAVIDTVQQNKKYGLAAMLTSGALAVGGTIIKPFFANGNGTYTLSKNPNNLNEKEILEKLNFSNGLITNMVTEELKGITSPNYVSVNKKKYF